MDEHNAIERLHDQAEKQINRAWKAYALLGVFLTVILSVGAIITHQSVSDFKSSIVDEVRTEKDIVQRQVTMQIAQEFDKDNIKRLVETEAQKQIDIVADSIIQKQLATLLTPKFEETNQELERLRTLIADSRATAQENEKMTRELEAVAEMTLRVFEAMADSREAYDQLKDIARDEKHEYAQLASRTVDKINETYNHKTGIYIHRELAYEGEPPIQDILAWFSKPDPIHRKSAVDTLWKIKAKETIPSVIVLLKDDPDLSVCYAAIHLLSEFTGEKSAPLDVQFWLSWWDRSKDSYTKNLSKPLAT